MTNLSDALTMGNGVIARADHPGLTHQIDVALRKGSLVPVLRGIYAAPERAADFTIRVLALRIADPRAVLTGASAACVAQTHLSPPTLVTAATRRLRSRSGFQFEHRRIPEALVEQRHGLRITAAALTALDLAGRQGASIDDALRRGVSLDALWAAYRLMPQRAGNTLPPTARRLARPALVTGRAARPPRPPRRGSYRLADEPAGRGEG